MDGIIESYLEILCQPKFIGRLGLFVHFIPLSFSQRSTSTNARSSSTTRRLTSKRPKSKYNFIRTHITKPREVLVELCHKHGMHFRQFGIFYVLVVYSWVAYL